MKQHTAKPSYTKLQGLIQGRLFEKLWYFYPETLASIGGVSLQSTELMFDLGLYAIGRATRDGKRTTRGGFTSVTVRPHEHLISNIAALAVNIFDDHSAAFHCLTHGFFKQAQAILRSTIESAVQLAVLDSHPESDLNRWTTGAHGIAGFQSLLEKVKNVGVMKESNRWLLIRNAYSLTCEATHSRKSRMVNRGLPIGYGVAGHSALAFEPFDAYFSLCLQAALLQTQIPLIGAVLRGNDEESAAEPFGPRIQVALQGMTELIEPFKQSTDRFAKGYLIHNEHAVLQSGKQILYSVKLDGEWLLRGRPKPRLTGDEFNRLRKVVGERLCQDIIQDPSIRKNHRALDWAISPLPGAPSDN
jgi:hypothetical protein